jgi:hypothetical protein
MTTQIKMNTTTQIKMTTTSEPQTLLIKMNTTTQTKKWTKSRTGYIYKLQCKAQNGKPLGLGCVEASWDKFIYIGSTLDKKRRCLSHKGDCNNAARRNHNTLVYMLIRENGGFDNWEMVELEKKRCESFEELRKLEQAWIDKVGPILNQGTAWVSEEEALKTKHAGQKLCYQNRKEHYKGKAADYYKNNKEKVLKRMKERAANDEEFKNDRKNYTKEWREKKKKDPVYMAAQKKKKEKNKEKIECDVCGRKVSRVNISTHKKTSVCKPAEHQTEPVVSEGAKELRTLQERYKELYGKIVSNRYRTNREWLKKSISDFESVGSVDELAKLKRKKNASTKIECTVCGKLVTKANMAKHQSRKACKPTIV